MLISLSVPYPMIPAFPCLCWTSCILRCRYNLDSHLDVHSIREGRAAGGLIGSNIRRDPLAAFVAIALSSIAIGMYKAYYLVAQVRYKVNGQVQVERWSYGKGTHRTNLSLTLPVATATDSATNQVPHFSDARKAEPAFCGFSLVCIDVDAGTKKRSHFTPRPQ